MCCFWMVLVFGGPRLGFLVFWLTPQGQKMIQLAFNTYFLPFLGLIFLPWTTLMIALVAGVNGLVGFDWLWVGLALASDIATYTSGAYKRKSVPGYPQSMP